MNILLVEPQYKNKYPPLSLMKISTYHKNKGDNVVFYKGIMPKEVFEKYNFDRIYITSLFTFYYSITIKTIKSYTKLISPSNIYVGGIMVSLMAEKVISDIDKSTNVVTGLLTNSSIIGYNDGTNIDILPLDYSILDHITYKYPAGDNYFAYISRGCTNKCKFCAVPILEPEFCMTNNIVNQINTTKELYGEKHNLLLLDNNILSFDNQNLRNIVGDIVSLGFDGETKFYPPLLLNTFFYKLSYHKQDSVPFNNILNELVTYLKSQSVKKMSKIYSAKYQEILTSLEKTNNIYSFIIKNKDILLEILSFYYKPKGRKRYVDFNQGIDARQVTKENMSILADIPINPFRLAYDNVKYTETYTKALTTAVNSGVNSFSNYILYNYDDKPIDLWDRLQININLAKQFNIKIFSFPMKYAPINRTDRNYIGKHWNKYFLSNIYAILNVSKGIVASGESFFYKAFGNNHNEFYKLLHMPRDFVTYRSKYEANGLTSEWEQQFLSLDNAEKSELLSVLCKKSKSKSKKISNILDFYKNINK